MKLAKLKVVQMRKELTNRGLDATGNRPALMKRLREALEKEQQMKKAEPKPTEQVAQPNPPENQKGQTQKNAQEESKSVSEQNEAKPRANEFNETVQPHPQDDQQQPDLEQPKSSPEPVNVRQNRVTELNTAEDKKVVEEQVNVNPSLGSGNLSQLKAIADEERMRRRMERFGLPSASAAPEKTSPRKAAGDSKGNTEEIEAERKRRRALRFGTGKSDDLDAEERQRRLKRLRRFQSPNKTTVV